ncbi:MAG TPA: CBS domain-containing protein [Flavobacteriaceae bacterium]|nr:CBS domain-containing protein [Flavobacteriaceae bacterium]
MGIKSYQGKRAEEIPSQGENITVEDYMTRDMITFRKEQSVLEVMETLIKHRVSGGPVVNENMELIGIISEGDCIKQISESRYYNMPMENISVEKYMVSNVETIPPEMNLFDAANKFLTIRKRRFPVCKDGKLVGLISQKDVLKAALKLTGNNWKK